MAISSVRRMVKYLFANAVKNRELGSSQWKNILEMINVTNKVDCCGCNACGDVCTHKSITLKTDIK